MNLYRRLKIAWRLFKEPHLYYPALRITGIILDAQGGKEVSESIEIAYTDSKPSDIIDIIAIKR